MPAAPPAQTPTQTRKLVVFAVIVVAALGALGWGNKLIRDREAALGAGGSAAMSRALQRLHRGPGTLSMTMAPGTLGERRLRSVDVNLLPRIDVLVLGQSDADHMSATFFRRGVGFYDAFISNSYFAYQYEAFEELVAAQGAPEIVLFDVRSGYILSLGVEIAYDTPAADPVWWAGAPFSRGARTPPFYRDLDSLLSLQQTEASARWLLARWNSTENSNGAAIDRDDGASWRIVPRAAPSRMYRWLADGSRVYPNEVEGRIVPRGQVRIDEAVGNRRPSPLHVAGMGEYLDRMRKAGATIIGYTPPVSPRVFRDHPEQMAVLRAMDAPVRAMFDSRGMDYCDLATEAAALGCTLADYYDEIHLSRACDRRIVRKLADGCAPRAGAALRAKLAPD